GSDKRLAAAALRAAKLREVDLVIDFPTPNVVIENIRACVRAGKNMVVGTTGWYDELSNVRQIVQKGGTGLLYAANFSIGVNLFFEIARTAAAAMRHGYHGQIFERHHAQKKDAPSGTAVAIQRMMHEACGEDLESSAFSQ